MALGTLQVSFEYFADAIPDTDPQQYSVRVESGGVSGVIDVVTQYALIPTGNVYASQRYGLMSTSTAVLADAIVSSWVSGTLDAQTWPQ